MHDVRIRHVRNRVTLLSTSLFIATLLFAARGLTKEPPKSKVAGLPAIRAAVEEKSKEAKSVGEFTEIVDLLRESGELRVPVEQDKYCREMLGWALNRRGEIYLKHASDQLSAGNQEESKRLDGLAFADFEAAVQSDPMKWKAIHNRGTSYALSGRVKEALADFSRVIELNSDYPNAWFNRAEIHFDRRDYDLAIHDYSEAIKRDGEFQAAYSKRGQSQLKAGKLRAALADFERVVKLDGDNSAAYVDRGEAQRILGNWTAAAADFRKAVELDKTFARAFQRIAWLMATCPEERFRNSARALQAARQAIELSDNLDFQNLDALAAALAESGMFEEARTEIARAIEAAPEEARGILKQRLELYEKDRPYRQKVETVAGK